MTEDHKRLLAVFDVRVRDLMELNAKCDNMLTARVVSVNEGEMKSARMRLSKLVREVDKCIALLNE